MDRERLRSVSCSVGAVCIVAIFFLFFLIWNSFFLQFQEGIYIDATFESVKGIVVGSSVSLSGVHVGSVVKMERVPLGVQVRMRMNQKIPIPDDSIFSIASTDMFGHERYVRVIPGGSPDFLENGSLVVNTIPGVSFDSLLSRLKL